MRQERIFESSNPEVAVMGLGVRKPNIFYYWDKKYAKILEMIFMIKNNNFLIEISQDEK